MIEHLDVVVPIVRRDQALPMLRSLHENTTVSHSVIVVDQTQPDFQASSPWSFTKRLWGLSDMVIKPKKNYGFAQAVDIGLRIAPSDWVCVANDDVLFIDGHDWVAGIEETFERFEKAAAVNAQSPKEPGWGWAEPGYRYLVPKEWPDETLQKLGTKDRKLREEFRDTRMTIHDSELTDEERRELEDEKSDLESQMRALRERMQPLVREACIEDPKYVEMLAEDRDWAVVDGFPCWLPVFRRDRLDEIGLFDERFFPGGGEDYCWMHRCYEAGYRALASSRSWAWHKWGQSKDRPDGRAVALPDARKPWNKLSTKGFGVEGLYDPDCGIWGDGERTDPEIYQAPL